jgi:hypothetical protein
MGQVSSGKSISAMALYVYNHDTDIVQILCNDKDFGDGIGVCEPIKKGGKSDVNVRKALEECGENSISAVTRFAYFEASDTVQILCNYKEFGQGNGVWVPIPKGGESDVNARVALEHHGIQAHKQEA